MRSVIWSWMLQVPANIIIITIVHGLFTLRVWKLAQYHRGWALAALCLFAMTTTLAINLTLVITMYTTRHFQNNKKYGWTIPATYASSTITDFVIAGSMIYYIRTIKIVSKHLSSRLAKVILYTVSSGLLTSACSMCTLLMYLLQRNTLVYFAVGFFLTKLYVGSYLAMLNARLPLVGDSFTSTERTTVNIMQPTNSSGFWSRHDVELTSNLKTGTVV